MKRLISMVALCVAFLFSNTSYAVSCSGTPTYSAGTNYTQNQSVQNKGTLYRCDVPGWCSSTAAWAYEPGYGSAWTLAWTSLGACTGTTSSVAASTASSKTSTAVSSVGSSVSTATYGVEAGASSATFFINGSTSFADLHYTKNNGAQLNVSMPLVNSRRAYTVTGLVNGDVIKYWFTYQPSSGGAVDTPSQTYTQGSVAASSKASSVSTTSRASSSSGGSGTDWSNFNPGSPTAGGTHPRLTIHNGCANQTMVVHWLTAPGFTGGQFNAANHAPIAAGGSVTYNIPDKGLASMRFWPGFGCDGTGQNCQVGQSGGPAEFGFTCPPQGCAPPIDSKFEASFGCITGIADGSCQGNPSAPGSGLGRNDWWNASAVDGFTVPVKVVVNGFCPSGQIDTAPYWGPGGPVGGQIDCSGLRVSNCPRNDNLSSDGRFPALSSVDLLAHNPAGGNGGCYSPSGKLTFANWGNTPTYTPQAPEAQWYACPTPPISPADCSAGPASRSKYHDYIHSVCSTYTYAYDDGAGLSSCPASTLTKYDVTFYCP